MSNVLVTGIAGLLGSRLSKWIVENTNLKVIGIDDLSGGFAENIDNCCCLVQPNEILGEFICC